MVDDSANVTFCKFTTCFLQGQQLCGVLIAINKYEGTSSNFEKMQINTSWLVFRLDFKIYKTLIIGIRWSFDIWSWNIAESEFDWHSL